MALSPPGKGVSARFKTVRSTLQLGDAEVVGPASTDVLLPTPLFPTATPLPRWQWRNKDAAAPLTPKKP